MSDDKHYAELAGDILDLISHRYKPDHTKVEYREGTGTLLEGIDEEATELVKQWAEKHFGLDPDTLARSQSPYQRGDMDK